MTASGWPATFADALESLDNLIPTATKQYLYGLAESDLDREHWALGLAIRNVLELWREDGPLTQWFAARGFTNGDEMSIELLRAYWRRLHSLPVLPEPSRGSVIGNRGPGTFSLFRDERDPSLRSG
jgi:hypothetical protein